MIVIDLPKPIPKHVKRQRTRHGKLVWYYRHATGGYTRLPDLFGTDDWWKAYNDADGSVGPPPKAKRKPVAKGSFEEALTAYLDASSFTRLADNTRGGRENILREILTRNPGMMLADIDRQSIVDGMDDRDPHPANSFLKAMAHFCKWAKSGARMAEDPTAGIAKVTAPKPSRNHAWTDEERAKFKAFWPVGSMQRLAYEIMWEGFRISDAATFCPDDIVDGLVEKITQKTGGIATFEIGADALSAIAALPICQTATVGAASPAFLRNAFGVEFASVPAARHWFVKALKKAGMATRCTPHGLRRARANFEAENGASGHEMMARFGWATLAEAEVYTIAADRRRIARQAGQRANRKSG